MAENSGRASNLPVLVNLSTQEKFYLDSQEVPVGRAPSNKIVLANDEFASGTHALIYWQDGWWIKDLGSSNGTAVDDRIINEPLKLAKGNIIKFGRTKFRIE